MLIPSGSRQSQVNSSATERVPLNQDYRSSDLGNSFLRFQNDLPVSPERQVSSMLNEIEAMLSASECIDTHQNASFFMEINDQISHIVDDCNDTVYTEERKNYRVRRLHSSVNITMNQQDDDEIHLGKSKSITFDPIITPGMNAREISSIKARDEETTLKTRKLPTYATLSPIQFVYSMLWKPLVAVTIFMAILYIYQAQEIVHPQMPDASPRTSNSGIQTMLAETCTECNIVTSDLDLKNSSQNESSPIVIDDSVEATSQAFDRPPGFNDSMDIRIQITVVNDRRSPSKYPNNNYFSQFKNLSAVLDNFTKEGYLHTMSLLRNISSNIHGILYDITAVTREDVDDAVESSL